MFQSTSLFIRCLALLCLCLCITFYSFGQKPPSRNGCGTDQFMDELRQSPNFFPKEQQFNQQIRDYLLKNHSPSSEKAPPPIYTLPIVIHVIHRNGDENISYEQILQGISDLNDGFANANVYDQGSGLDTEIRFCLATIDEQGNLTNGVTRHESHLTIMHMTKDDSDLKDISRWDPTKYINIWLVNTIKPNCDLDPAGYATLPGSAGSDTDGIVCEASTFGSSRDGSKVAIHEMGHYLGLLHTFEGGCANGDCTLEGDMICDTPPDNSTESLAACAPDNSCSTDSLSGFTSDVPDLATNYMDYGASTCFHDFTPNQSERMRAVVATIRSSLLATPTCATLCANGQMPSSYFEMSHTEISEGGTVTFTRVGSHLELEWQINGATVSSEPRFDYTFDEAGTYSISLILRDSANGADCQLAIHELLRVTCGLDASLRASTSDILPGESIIFTSNTPGASSSEWLVNGQSMGTGNSYTHLFADKGNYLVQMIARNAACVDTSKAFLYKVGTQYVDATLEILQYACSNDSILISFEVCNRNDETLPIQTPIQFYDNHPFNTPAQALSNPISLSEDLPCECCVEMTAGFPKGNISNALYGIVNDSGSKSTPLMQADYPLTVLEELDYTNNMDSLAIDLVDVSFAPNLITIDLGQGVILEPIISPMVNDSMIYTWEPADSLSCTDCPNPFANPLLPMTYTLTVDDGQGCTSSDTIRVEPILGKKVTMPNAFSPNNDGLNDIFSVIADPSVKTVKDFKVYNRWGELLFERQNFIPKNADTGWDGTYKGEVMMMGVYVYSVHVEYLDNETRRFKGNVTLIR